MALVNFPLKVSGLLILFYTNFLEISKNKKPKELIIFNDNQTHFFNTSKPQPIIVFDFLCANNFVSKIHNKTADIDL